MTTAAAETTGTATSGTEQATATPDTPETATGTTPEQTPPPSDAPAGAGTEGTGEGTTEGAPADGSAPGDGTTEGKKDETKDEVKTEVTYDLTKPEGTALTDAALERIAAVARERGLTPEQAQAVVDLNHELASDLLAAGLAAYQPGGAEYEKIVEGWKAETLADPFLGKSEAERVAAINLGKQVLDRFKTAHPEEAAGFVDFLEASGYGNQRDVARFFKWLGGAMAEQPMPHGGTTGAPKDARTWFDKSEMNP